jgi:nicotinate-nucleotide adenylyltransferase
MTQRRVGILGGTFDPVHLGHADAANAAQSALGLARIYIIPSNVPPHRPQPAASSFHRFAMVALAAALRPAWRASDLELRADRPSYTSATLEQFHARGYVPDELFFVIGADAFADLESWRNYPAILDYAHFVVVSRAECPATELRRRLPRLAPRMIDASRHIDLQPRPGIILLDVKTADVSATAIRQLRADGKPIAGLVDAGVQQHIEQHGLYASRVPGRRASDERSSPAAGRLHGKG